MDKLLGQSIQEQTDAMGGFRNIPDLFWHCARRYADSVLFRHIDSNEEIKYGQVAHAVGAGGAWLIGQGLKPGDRVIISLRNAPEFLIVFMALVCRGLIPVLSNPTLSNAELASLAQRSEAKALIAIEPDIVERTKIPNLLMINAKNFSPTKSFTFICDNVSSNADDVAYIMFSTGSTGRPKGCLLTHRNMVSETLSIQRAHRLPDDCTHLCLLPMFHVSGLYRHLLAPLSQGNQVVIGGSFSLVEFWDWIDQYNIGYVQVVPSIISMLLNAPYEPSRKARAGLHYIGTASAPLLPQIQRQFEERFDIRIAQGFGLTETTCGVCFNHPGNAERKIGSVGKPIDIARVAIVNEKDELLPPGEMGEIIVSGPLVMAGYLSEYEGIAKLERPGVFRTGDFGYLDQEGSLYIEARKTDFINRAAFKISPKEVEAALLDLPGVNLAIVFGVPDETLGEDLIAYIQLENNSGFGESQVRKQISETLARYKIPSRILPLPEVLGPNANFKQSRSVYRQYYLEQCHSGKRADKDANRVMQSDELPSKQMSSQDYRATPHPRAFLFNSHIYLRPLMEADTKSEMYLNNIMSPEVQKLTKSGRFPQSDWALAEFWSTARNPEHLVFAICEANSHRHVGNCALRIDWLSRIGELGRFIFKEYQDAPYSSYALELLMKYAFEDLSLKRLWSGGCNPSSVPSLIRYGFKLREHYDDMYSCAAAGVISS